MDDKQKTPTGKYSLISTRRFPTPAAMVLYLRGMKDAERRKN